MIAVTDSTMAADEDSLSLADFDDSDPFTYIIFVHTGVLAAAVGGQ